MSIASQNERGGAIAALFVRRPVMGVVVNALIIVAGLAAFFGHLFPMWLGFKGGKGVATQIGVLFGLFWPLGLIFLGVWIAMAVLFRISSLSALTASALSPLWAILLGRSDLALPAAIMGIAVYITHRANIARLFKGEEPRIGKSKTT